MNALITFAQNATMPHNLTDFIWVAMTSAFGGISVVYGWFRSELNECQKDRKILFARVESLHEEVSALSMRVGQTERRITTDSRNALESGGT